MSKANLSKKLTMSIDGVVFTMPPDGKIDRDNFVKHGLEKIWRKPGEKLPKELEGKEDYFNQSGIKRCVPLWGGISSKGFAVLSFHARKKVRKEEWVRKVVKSGALKKAIDKLALNRRGPHHLLCDNESFLASSVVKKAHSKMKVKIWTVPPKSPDLNPIEQVWSWVRRRLRAMDLKDAKAGKATLTKEAYTRRIRNLVQTKTCQKISANIAKGFRKSCRMVVASGGAAVDR